MTAFSRPELLKSALEIKLRRAKTMVKKFDTQFSVEHPNEVSEYATNKKYTELTKRVTLEINKYQTRALKRRDKLAGRI